MRSRFVMSCCLAVLALLTASDGWCHGVEGYVEQIEAHCITAMYDDGEPMSYAAVEVNSPDKAIAFQTGRTDCNGRFMVKTDTPGIWQVVVSDGMGHRLALDFPVAADQETSSPVEKTAAPQANHPLDRPIKVIAGLSIIFGLCGVAYGWKARQKHNI